MTDQIQQHEWRYKGSNYITTQYFNCKNCPALMSIDFNGQKAYSKHEADEYSKEEPPCITRPKEGEKS